MPPQPATAISDASAGAAPVGGERRSGIDSPFALTALLSPDGTVVSAGGGGLDPAALIGRPLGETLWRLAPPADQARLWDLLDAARRGRPSRLAARLPLAETRWADLDITLVPLRDGRGCLAHVALTVAETAPASEATQELALQAGEVATWAFDAATGRYAFSRSIAQLFGFPPEAPPPDMQRFAERVHPADQPMVAASFRQAIAERAEHRIEYRVVLPDGAIRWLASRGEPVLDGAGRLTRMVGAVVDVTDRKWIELALLEAHHQNMELLAQIESLLTYAPIGFAFFDRAHRYVRLNATLAEINGLPVEAHLGRAIGDILPVNARTFDPILDRVFATGTAVRDLEIVGETAAAPGVTRTWLTEFYPVKTGDETKYVGAVVVDITERKRAEEHQRKLLDELSHRVKNTLATVQALAAQSLRHDSPEAFAHAFNTRLAALAYTHNLLSQSQWREAPLRDLVRAALGPFQSAEAQTIAMAGPDVSLKPTAALAFALALHELAVNASKYGALSCDSGRVDVRWRVDETAGPRLCLEWQESGGPAIAPPARRGFGTRFIERSFAYELDGEARLDFRAEGLACHITVPWSEVAETERRYMALQHAAAR